MATPIEAVVGRAFDEIKHASSTVSQNVRSIGIGLSLLVYTLVVSADKVSFVEQHYCQLVFAAACGVLCVVLDYLQYYFMIWENRSVLGTLREEKQEIAGLVQANDIPAAQARAEALIGRLDDLRGENSWAAAREFCFHAKGLFALLGAAAIVYLIAGVIRAA